MRPLAHHFVASLWLQGFSPVARLACDAVVVLVQRGPVGRVTLGNVPAAILMRLGAVLVIDRWLTRGGGGPSGRIVGSRVRRTFLRQGKNDDDHADHDDRDQ